MAFGRKDMRGAWWSSVVLTGAIGFLQACGGGASGDLAGASARCSTGEAVVTDGNRRLALIVGVGEYGDETVTDLPGATADARKMHALLTNEELYGFPEENVCVLLDAAATKDAFVRAFDEAIVARAQANDVVVVFFAGHGSQMADANADEPDEWDETFAFHESNGWGDGELSDDDFHAMLQRLHARTQNVVTIVDSCNSGSATRGGSEGRARFIPRSTRPAVTGAPSESGDGAESWAPASLPGLVALTAASDGTSALEVEGKGVFTDALVSVLSEPRTTALTYAQLARRVPPLVAAASEQIPYFQGDLNRPVFGNTSGTRPVGWDVIRAEPLELGGTPLTGVGEGAEFRIYDGGASAAEVRDPAKAKATVVVTASTGLNADAVVSSRPPGAAAIVPGDLAILVRGGDAAVRIRVAIRDEQRPGGVAAQRADALRTAIRNDPDAATLVELVAAEDEFEISVNEREQLVLRGPENRTRIAYASDAAVPRNLAQHARQKGLVALRGEGGADFVDQQTLRVQLVPAPMQSTCADGEWEQAEPFVEQIVPLCHSWQVRVELAAAAPMPLLIGGVVLSSDGSTFGFPVDGRAVELNPGQSVTFDTREETLMGNVPLDVQEHVLVFGTQKTNPVSWHLMRESAAVRGAAPEAATSPLARALNAYLTPGSRGATQAGQVAENTTWTMSSVAMRVRANQTFAKPAPGSTTPSQREYTLRNFDVRPYLPDDQDTALYAVLMEADTLAGASRREGYSYKQHDWSAPTDDQNLAKGIDCSRAIWWAFTRSGLDYNRSNDYLTTAQMVGNDSWMADEFDQCPAEEEPRIGDLLVYRSDQKNDGHVVMVIDPVKRVAWGSHGWDGSARDSDYVVQPDTGVEYQLIKYKQDWRRWDRQDMELKMCWRHRQLAAEGADGSGVPGQSALSRTCTQLQCRM
jgi:hypothetical protein